MAEEHKNTIAGIPYELKREMPDNLIHLSPATLYALADALGGSWYLNEVEKTETV